MTSDSISFLAGLLVVALLSAAANEPRFLWIQFVEAWSAKARNLEWKQSGTIPWRQPSQQARLRHSGTFANADI